MNTTEVMLIIGRCMETFGKHGAYFGKGRAFISTLLLGGFTQHGWLPGLPALH